MDTCLFVSDLHGHVDRYEKLLRAIEVARPSAVFLGGDLLPPLYPTADAWPGDFVGGFLADRFGQLRRRMAIEYPQVFLILGNDDARIDEAAFLAHSERDIWTYVHGRQCALRPYVVYGYAFVPPTPFRLKDWERYDVSRYVDPGCSSPEEGWRSVPVSPSEIKYGTIRDDLDALTDGDPMERAIFLFHTPAYQTKLDRAALDGRMVDHVPVDVHVGSIAVRRFIEQRQPLVTLHGHIHESARLTGSWRDRIGRTHLFGAAHDGAELALVRFDLEDPDSATRQLL